MPLKIKLINMPFASLHVPSIALTQLRSVTRARYPTQTELEIAYVNHDFGGILGPDTYEDIASGPIGQNTGLGDWLFRRVAFPEELDNTRSYLARYEHQFRSLDAPPRRLLFEVFRDGLERQLDDIIDQYRLMEADVIGLTSMFFQTLASIAMARRLKLKNPDLVIVMGGANCEGSMGVELVNHVTDLDFVFSGHSLCSFPDLIGCLLRRDHAACDRIDGVFTRRNSRSTVSLATAQTDPDWGKADVAEQLHGVAQLGRELPIQSEVPLEYEDFLSSLRQRVPSLTAKPTLTFETSRGCWWGERAHCTFCGLNGGTMSYRAMRPDHAVSLINGLIDRYGNDISVLQCVDNILPREYVDEVLPRLTTPDHVEIFYEVKSDLPERAVQALARAGVKRVQPGVEALATSTLKLMRKGVTSFVNVSFLMSCRAHNVTPEWNLLVGFPGETQEVFAMYVDVLPLLFHLPPPAGVFPVRFDRFSPYFTEQRAYGLKLKPYDFYPLCYPFPALSLMNMAYYFEDASVDAPYIQSVSNWIARLRDVVARWRRIWTKTVDRRPTLHLMRGEHAVVVDSRSGVERRSVLTPAELRLLESLGGAVGEERLSEEDRKVLAGVIRKGFVFRERGKVMSIVSGVATRREGSSHDAYSPRRLTSSKPSSSADMA